MAPTSTSRTKTLFELGQLLVKVGAHGQELLRPSNSTRLPTTEGTIVLALVYDHGIELEELQQGAGLASRWQAHLSTLLQLRHNHGLGYEQIEQLASGGCLQPCLAMVAALAPAPGTDLLALVDDLARSGWVPAALAPVAPASVAELELLLLHDPLDPANGLACLSELGALGLDLRSALIAAAAEPPLPHLSRGAVPLGWCAAGATLRTVAVLPAGDQLLLRLAAAPALWWSVLWLHQRQLAPTTVLPLGTYGPPLGVGAGAVVALPLGTAGPSGGPMGATAAEADALAAAGQVLQGTTVVVLIDSESDRPGPEAWAEQRRWVGTQPWSASVQEVQWQSLGAHVPQRRGPPLQ